MVIDKHIFYKKTKKFLHAMIGDKWLNENKVKISRLLNFENDLSFDATDEIIMMLFFEREFGIELEMTDGWFETVNDMIDSVYIKL